MKVGIFCTAEIEHFDIAHACTLEDIKEITQEYIQYNCTLDECEELRNFVAMWHDERMVKELPM
jgi:hypothetical protein